MPRGAPGAESSTLGDQGGRVDCGRGGRENQAGQRLLAGEGLRSAPQ